MDSRAVDVCVRILLEADEIEKRRKEFNITEAAWHQSRAMRDLLLMPLIQIGELTTHFGDADPMALFPNVPWREIKGFRNVVVHGYGQIDANVAWNTATDGVGDLRTALLESREVADAYDFELERSSVASHADDDLLGFINEMRTNDE